LNHTRALLGLFTRWLLASQLTIPDNPDNS